VPADAESVELWRHVSRLVRYPNFAELKRERLRSPDRESVRRWEAQQPEQTAA
jgi:hypothetical protein